MTITDAEMDILGDLWTGDSCASPEDYRYAPLMAFIERAMTKDKREYDADASVARNDFAMGYGDPV